MGVSIYAGKFKLTYDITWFFFIFLNLFLTQINKILGAKLHI